MYNRKMGILLEMEKGKCIKNPTSMGGFLNQPQHIRRKFTPSRGKFPFGRVKTLPYNLSSRFRSGRIWMAVTVRMGAKNMPLMPQI